MFGVEHYSSINLLFDKFKLPVELPHLRKSDVFIDQRNGYNIGFFNRDKIIS